MAQGFEYYLLIHANALFFPACTICCLDDSGEVAWVDHDRAHDDFVEDETANIAKLWKDRTPGHLEWQKAYKAQQRNEELTARQKAVLKNSIEGADEARSDASLDEFNKAHQVIDELSADGVLQDDPFGLDFAEEDELQELALQELGPESKKKYKGWCIDFKAGVEASKKRISAIFSPVKGRKPKKSKATAKVTEVVDLE